MKALIVYDSQFGNTEQIALAMYNALKGKMDTDMLRVGDLRPEHLAGLDLLIFGSPTQRFNATTRVNDLLKGLPKNSLAGVGVAAFDTRLTLEEINQTPVLPFFVKLWGRSAYAAQRIATHLRKKGGAQVLSPEGFYVTGTEGPLVDGELERAMQWAEQIRENIRGKSGKRID